MPWARIVDGFSDYHLGNYLCASARLGFLRLSGLARFRVWFSRVGFSTVSFSAAAPFEGCIGFEFGFVREITCKHHKRESGIRRTSSPRKHLNLAKTVPTLPILHIPPYTYLFIYVYMYISIHIYIYIFLLGGLIRGRDYRQRCYSDGGNPAPLSIPPYSATPSESIRRMSSSLSS